MFVGNDRSMLSASYSDSESDGPEYGDDEFNPRQHEHASLHLASSSHSDSPSPSDKLTDLAFTGPADDMFIWTGYDTRFGGRTLLFWLGVVFSFGILWIVTFWLPHLKLKLSAVEVPLWEADKIVLQNVDYKTTITGCLSQDTGSINTDVFVVEVVEHPIDLDVARRLGGLDDYLNLANDSIRLCSINFQLHGFSTTARRFIPLTTLGAIRLDSVLAPQPRPLDSDRTQLLQKLFGANEIKIPMPSIASLLLKEIFHPFYIFQIFSIILWLLEDYWGYAIVIFVAALLSTSSTVYSIRTNAARLRKMAHFDIPVKVLKLNRLGQPVEEECSSRDLVPGDIILLEDNLVLPCDVQVLTKDGNVLVNEALLTGESIPVPKMSYTKCVTDIEESLLFGGTTVIQSRPRGQVRARVLSTGYQTAKGVLMRSILVGSSSANVSEFTQQGFVVVGILFVIALAGVAVNSWMIPDIDFNASDFHQSLDILDVVTIAVPPALPVALSVGISFAMSRLRQNKIFCISPNTINVAGQIEHVCFDKTGTLTQDDLRLNGLIDPRGAFIESVDIPIVITLQSALYLILSACHSLMKLEDSDETVGDPLELTMFESLGPDIALDVSGASPRIHGTCHGQPINIEIVHRFPFASRLQRMSVVMRLNGDRYFVVMKGSPEVVTESFCQPLDIGTPWNVYTQSGFRVLASAVRAIDDPEPILRGLAMQDKNARDLVELPGAFSFAGCLVFENPLKPTTTATILELTRIGLRSVMITGDHPLTALHVAKECHIVRVPQEQCRSFLCDAATLSWVEVSPPPGSTAQRLSMDDMMSEVLLDDRIVLVVNGVSYAKMCEASFSPYDFDMILRHCNVFARMKPDQKASLVGFFMERLGVRTAMVGDGSNDCSALKRADVGLSLSSEAEATMAAPFTSSSPSPTSLLTLLREGRCALVTSISAFKYIVFYSMIQFTGIELLYSSGATFGNWHFLFQDLFSVLPLALVMSNTHAASTLSVARPPGQIISIFPMVSMAAQILLQAFAQIAVIIWLKSRSFYTPVVENHTRLDPLSFETTSVLDLSMFMLVFNCLALSIGTPFRKEFWTNRLLTGISLLILGFALFMTFGQVEGFDSYIQLEPLPRDFQFSILGLGCIYGILSAVIEFCLGRGTKPPTLKAASVQQHNFDHDLDQNFDIN